MNIMGYKFDADEIEAKLADEIEAKLSGPDSTPPLAKSIDETLAKHAAFNPDALAEKIGDDIQKRRAADKRTKEDAYRAGVEDSEKRVIAAEAAVKKVAAEAKEAALDAVAKEMRRWSEALALVTDNDPAAALCVKLLIGSRMATSDIVEACEQVRNKASVTPMDELTKIMSSIPDIIVGGIQVSDSKGYRNEAGEYQPSEREKANFLASIGINPESGNKIKVYSASGAISI